MLCYGVNPYVIFLGELAIARIRVYIFGLNS